MSKLTISPCCLKTIDHEGTAIGQYKTIGGLDTYQTGAEFGDDKIIVILTDIFGYKYNNNRLVADELSKKGKIQVLVPDILMNDPIADIQDYMSRADAWRAKHTVEATSAIIRGFLNEVKSSLNPSFIGGIGHCFGAKYVVLELAANGLLSVGGIAHPSNLQVEDIEAITKPLVISAAEVDQAYPAELMSKSIEILNKNNIHYQLTVFQGTSHGYAIRGDPTDGKIRYAQAKTIVDQIDFFNLYKN